jgi:spore maturation protein CgeB
LVSRPYKPFISKEPLNLAFSFLIVDTYYPSFLDMFYERHPEHLDASYESTLAALMAEGFGTSDFYTTNLRLLGHSATDVIANDHVLQAKWASNHRLLTATTSAKSALKERVPGAWRLFKDFDRDLEYLARRIEEERPDVLYFQNLSLCDPRLINAVRPYVKLIIGQIASSLPSETYLRGCDLLLTSYQPYIERFRKMGIACEYLGIGFESTILARLTTRSEYYGAVFVGGFANVHNRSTRVLEEAARDTELHVWGYGSENVSTESPLRRHYHGEAWGIDMYSVLFNSKIAINRHGLVEPEYEYYGNNMRLYEATGVGTMLITEEKSNLGELFDVGSEIMTYQNANDLVEKITYYLTHERERRSIALAGQERTLRDYTYLQRMRELERIVEAYA